MFTSHILRLSLKSSQLGGKEVFSSAVAVLWVTRGCTQESLGL